MKKISNGLIIFENFLSKEECDLLTFFLDNFPYDKLEEHYIGFWGKRLLNQNAVISQKGLEDSFNLIEKILPELKIRVLETIKTVEDCDWDAASFNLIKMYRGSYQTKNKSSNNLEMYYHFDDQEHMQKEIFWGVVIYPNDKYIGGEIDYPHENFSYKPKPGDMVMHSGKTVHGVKEVVDGNRYSITSFIGKNNEFREIMKPVETGNPQDPYHYPPGFNGQRMPNDPIKGSICVPRQDGSFGPFQKISRLGKYVVVNKKDINILDNGV
jgi:hypothetical protein